MPFSAKHAHGLDRTLTIQGVYGDKVAADIERNCAVRLVLRPAGLAEANKISEQLGSYTFRARSRSIGTWGGGGSTSHSDQRRAFMLPQEVELLPENDLIVFRRGMYATYGKKVRYYAEKKLAERTRIPAPQIPLISPNSAAANSLRAVQAGETGSNSYSLLDITDLKSSTSRKYQDNLNNSAIQAALTAAPDQRVAQLFNNMISLHERICNRD